MAFAVENIQIDDQEKILKDASVDERKSKLLIKAKATKRFPRKWAVDREKNCYLFLAPLAFYEEGANQPYFTFVEGKIYQFNLSGPCSNKAYFVGEIPEPGLQELIKEAFLVHGRWGRGQEPNEGKPELSFISSARNGE